MPDSLRSPDPSGPSAFLRVFLGAHALFLVLWAVVVARFGPQQNDWAVFKGVADRFVAGEIANLYTRGADGIVPGYFWIYPPFVLYPLSVLAPLPPLAAYLLLAAVAVGATALSLRWLGRLCGVEDDRETWILVVICSAPFLTTVVTGQLSALLLLGIVGAGRLWTAGRAVAAGALLGLTVAKPNWGVAFGLMMLVRGEWRGAAAMAAVALLCCAGGLLPGPELWQEFFRAAAVSIEVQGHYDPYTIVTLRGFLEAVLPSAGMAYFVWGVAALAMLAAAVSIWRRRGSSPLDCLASVVLLVLAANPYAHFYDALVLVLPATVWWTGREKWAAGPWRAVGGLLAVAWIWEHAAWSWPMLGKLADLEVELPFSLVGPAATLWLLLWASSPRR
jgi:hypothetical protein